MTPKCEGEEAVRFLIPTDYTPTEQDATQCRKTAQTLSSASNVRPISVQLYPASTNLLYF
jgi:hypothetical protein